MPTNLFLITIYGIKCMMMMSSKFLNSDYIPTFKDWEMILVGSEKLSLFKNGITNIRKEYPDITDARILFFLRHTIFHEAIELSGEWFYEIDDENELIRQINDYFGNTLESDFFEHFEIKEMKILDKLKLRCPIDPSLEKEWNHWKQLLYIETYEKLENLQARYPTVDVIQKLVDFLHIDPGYLNYTTTVLNDAVSDFIQDSKYYICDEIGTWLFTFITNKTIKS